MYGRDAGTTDGEDKTNLMICSDCVYQPTLKQFVMNNGGRMVCNYCKQSGLCVQDSKLAEWMLKKAKEALIPTDELSAYEQAMIFECGSDTPAVFELWAFFEETQTFACHEVYD